MTERRLSGLPHSSNKDDVYKGFFIPKGQIPLNCTFCFWDLSLTTWYKGSIMVANAWYVGCLTI
jgi:hypothetical protein